MRDLPTSNRRSIRFLRMMTFPHMGVLAGAAISATAWWMPAISEAGKGFVATPPTTQELIHTLGAYAVLAFAAVVGYLMGVILSRRLPGLSGDRPSDLRRTEVWTFSISIAFIGVLLANVVVIRALGINGCIESLVTFNANAFKYALYADYMPGLLSLRYAAIVSGAIAIFRYLAFKEMSARSVVSIFLLLFVALFSSRLSLVWATVMGTLTYLLYPADRPKRIVGRSEVISCIALLFLVLGALTVSRTYGFYRARGAETVVSAIGSEFQRYLAAPFQGSIESVNSPNRRTNLSQSAGIDGGLSTNSAFMEYAILLGRWNVVALALTLVTSSLICGLLRRYSGTYLILAFGVLQGCHLEVWRLAMFHRGITLSLLTFSLVIPLVMNVAIFPTIHLPKVRLKL